MGKEWDNLAGKGIVDDVEAEGGFQDGAGGNPYTRSRIRFGVGAVAQEWHQAWATEALRVLRPGGHLLAFGGTRTYHRLACAVEDAGFEIRDSLIWLYGSGFPKSLDVSKAIDKQRDDYEARCLVAEWLRPHVEAYGFAEVTAHFGFKDETMARARWTSRSQPNTPTLAQWAELKSLLSLPDDMDAEVWRLNGRKGQPGGNWEKREKLGVAQGAGSRGNTFPLAPEYDDTAPATPEAQRWQGWGTALKPGHEPIVVARKPLIGTVAENVQAHGTGALNVDGCRIGTEQRQNQAGQLGANGIYGQMERNESETTAEGRWPANVALSHLPECEPVGERRVKGHGGYPNGPGGNRDRAVPITGERDDWAETPHAGHADADGMETVTAYRCAPGCPVAELDAQSGAVRSSGHVNRSDSQGDDAQATHFGIHGKGYAVPGENTYGDTGGASRFFYTAKSSRAERTAGVGANAHPT